MRTLFCIFACVWAMGAYASGSLRAHTGPPEVRLQDYQPFEYDLRFTNPQCATYAYPPGVVANDGQVLVEKPKDIYCKSGDLIANLNKPGSPSEKILEWIRQPKTREIFMTYLSFSSVEVAEALCAAMNRGVKVRLVQDAEQDQSRFMELETCGGDLFDGYLRGHVEGIDFAHNKVFVVNPSGTDDEIQISFGSGNLTSGIVLHHENWHFITTNRQSYFAQSHLCLMNAEIDHAASAKTFNAALATCLEAIKSPRESDIQAFFVPLQGREAWATAGAAIAGASRIRLAAHRFSFNKMMAALTEKLSVSGGFDLSMLFDDDLFRARRPNTPNEKKHVEALEALGAKPRYLETNHGSNLIHHNKFMLFDSPQGLSAFIGAGNFTGTAFTSNWENFYFVRIPSVLEKLETQFEYLYSKGTPASRLPATDVLP